MAGKPRNQCHVKSDNWGGRRAGAGAPKNNKNRQTHGLRSREHLEKCKSIRQLVDNFKELSRLILIE